MRVNRFQLQHCILCGRKVNRYKPDSGDAINLTSLVKNY